jgi:hypothetical protein
MLWIKRNLLLAIGGLLAVLLLAFGVFYFITNRQKNKQIEAQLEENKSTLTRLISQAPFPNPTNITRAKEELLRVREAITNARAFFQPVPFEPVTDQAFKAVLDNTVYDLHQKAEDASVVLPSPSYAFTFEHQKRQLQFPPEAFPALPQQLAEIKTLCEMLFQAKINKLITFRRSRLYAEEPLSQVDHHEFKPEVDEAMGMASNPYEVVFHAFSTELATALGAFAKSTNGVVVKSLAVEVATLTADPNQPMQGFTQAPPVVNPALTQPQPVRPGTQPAPAPAARPFPRGQAVAPKAPEGIKTVLNEKLLKITMVLEVMRTVSAQNAGQKAHGFTQKTQ